MALLGDVSRRDLLKRAALVGGTLVWAVPVIESLNMPAYAASVPPTRLEIQLSTDCSIQSACHPGGACDPPGFVDSSTDPPCVATFAEHNIVETSPGPSNDCSVSPATTCKDGVCLTITSGTCIFLSGTSHLKHANTCVSGVISMAGKRITFPNLEPTDVYDEKFRIILAC